MRPLPFLCLSLVLSNQVPGQGSDGRVEGWLSELEKPRTEAGRQAFQDLCNAGAQAFLTIAADLNAHLEELEERALHGAPHFRLPETILHQDPTDPSQQTLATFQPDPDSMLDLTATPVDPMQHWLFREDRGLEPGECRALASILWLTHQESGAAASLPLLLKILDHPRRELVEEAARAIGAIGPPVARPLTDLLHDRQRGWVAATILGHLGDPGRQVLEEELAVDDRRTRLRALFGLALASGNGTERTWRLVASHLGSLDMVLTRLAVWCLSRAGSAALPVLQEILDEGKPLARAHATCALGLMGPPASPAIDTILAQLRREAAMMGQWSAEALGRIAPGSDLADEAVEALIDVSRNAKLPLRLACLTSLGNFPRQADRVLPVLRGLLREEGAYERYHVLQAVMRLGAAGSSAWPDVRALADDDWEELQVSAVEAMGDMDGSAVPDLVRALLEPHLRKAALDSLRRLGGEVVTSRLVDMLTDDATEVRLATARALAVADVTELVGDPVLPALRQLLEDPDEEVRAAAAEAVKLLGGGVPEPASAGRNGGRREDSR